MSTLKVGITEQPYQQKQEKYKKDKWDQAGDALAFGQAVGTFGTMGGDPKPTDPNKKTSSTEAMKRRYGGTYTA